MVVRELIDPLVHERGRLGDDDRALGIALVFPGLEAFLGCRQLLLELLVGQFVEVLEELAGGGVEALIGHDLVLFPMLSWRLQVRCSLGLDDDLERLGLRGRGEGLVGIEDMVELEAMRDQQLGVDLVRPDRLEQHRYGDGVDQPRGDGDVAVPQALEMEIHLLAVHADIGDGAARRDDLLAKLEGGGNADRLDRGVDAALAGQSPSRASAALPSVLLIVCVAPNLRATSRRLSSRSIMMISAGE